MYPDNFQVAKYSVFEKTNSNTWYVLELQSVGVKNERQYRVVRYWKDAIGTKKAAVRDMLVFLSTSEEALAVYQALRKSLQAAGLHLRSNIHPQAQDLGSAPLQQLLLEEKLNTGSLSQEVGVFVELLWTEALGCLGNILRVSVNKLSLNDVSRAEGLLLQAQRKLNEANHAEVIPLLVEVYTLLPHWAPEFVPNAKLISQKLDLCQLIRDVLNVSEMTLRSPAPSCVGKFRALRCSIDTIPPRSSEFQAVTALLQDSKVKILQVLRVSRGLELQTFKSDLGNIKTLLHSSRPSNFVGILSRGLLLPRVGVEHHGIERTDAGNLGSGIYFSDVISTSLKYSKPSATDGSRLLLVCDVALGQCKDVRKTDLTLTQAPEGYHSVHGVRYTRHIYSEFEDDEYVVYSPDQVKLKYVIWFSVEGDALTDFGPAVNTSAELCPPSSDQELCSEDDGIEMIKNPLEDITAGLLDGSGQQLPLQAVHVKCKLMDLLSQVIIFQKYTNMSSVPIEAKYVFPLDDSAAVCGFEAFINGKHVVGQVKEKERARKEYKQAIEKGHGAYLMDQDAPDVFTISVGNLPPGATVLIKVTFVSELIIRDGGILFTLPGSVAPWQKSAALNQTTQVTVEKVCLTDEAASTREFTLDMSIEMPYEISSLQCITHKIKMKRTDCKAVVSVLPGEVMGPDGFQLSVTLSEVHLPRMWVEEHPDKDSQACMLVFFPDFDISSSSASNEVVLLLDTSESMKGESLHMAQRIALQILKVLGSDLRVNVILFGTDHQEAFLTAQPLAEARQAAESFIKVFTPVGGSTELWRPLRALSLLPPSHGIRNLLLLSDGHIQSTELSLQLLRENAQHSRLFTCGLSSTANRHMLRALAQAGGGAYEFFDTKTKHNWAEKVARQVKRMTSPGCSSVSVKWQQFSPTAPTPVQAPKQLHALFNDCHTLVYGFVPHCTQATLLGNLSGQELKTMVSTSELQKTRGTFLHKLTARALIRDYEDGSLDSDEAEHEGKKAELKSFIIGLSREFSILSQFTSFVAIEERDPEQTEDGFTDIPKLIAEEDVDILTYISWISPEHSEEEDKELSDVLCDTCYSLPDLAEELPIDGASFSDYLMLERSRKRTHELESGTESNEAMGVSFVEDELALSDIDLMEGLDTSCPPLSGNAALSLSPAPHILRTFHALAHSGSAPCPAPPLSGTPIALPRLAPALPGPSPYLKTMLIPSLPCPAPPPPCSAPPLPCSAPPPPRRASRLLCQAPLPPGSAPPPPPCPAPPPALLGNIRDMEPRLKRSAGHRRAFRQRHGEFSSPDITMYSGSHPSFFAQELATGALMTSSLAPDLLDTEKSSAVSVELCTAAVPIHLAKEASLAPVMAADTTGIKVFSYEGAISNFAFDQDSDYIASYESSVQFLGTSDHTEPNLVEKAQLLSHSVEKIQPPRSCFGFGLAQREPEHVGDARPSVLRRKRLSLICPQTSGVLDALDVEMTPADPETLTHKWTKIFQMQHSEGYWELTTELGESINVDVDLFANVYLQNKGIRSLGVRAHADILRLLATLLVLQLMRVERLEEGKLLHTLFRLDDSSQPRSEHWEEVKRAVDWVCWADRQYPCAYSRLEFGWSWEASTRQLLGYEDLPPFSPLRGLNLQLTTAPLLVH
nr:poly [ADP-ribose] polymerase 4 isoform X2 [Monopterus albus]